MAGCRAASDGGRGARVCLAGVMGMNSVPDAPKEVFATFEAQTPIHVISKHQPAASENMRQPIGEGGSNSPSHQGIAYPTDVLAGWTVGSAWAMLCWIVAMWLQRRAPNRAEIV